MIRDDPLLQMQWDAALIKAWHDNGLMSYLSAPFMGKHGLSFDDLALLKRTPRSAPHFKRPVRAFVANSLPALSHWLWDTTQSPAEIVLRLGDSAMDTVYGRASKALKELRSEDRKLRSLRRVDVHYGHRRSDWQVCKA